MMYEINIPLTLGMSEFNKISIAPYFERKCGGFFVENNDLNSPIFRVVLEEFFG